MGHPVRYVALFNILGKNGQMMGIHNTKARASHTTVCSTHMVHTKSKLAFVRASRKYWIDVAEGIGGNQNVLRIIFISSYLELATSS